MLAQVSDEAERSVLVKLKTECGYQFTSKLESMFTDIKTSRDTMQEYKARRQAASTGEEDVELAVQVCAMYFIHDLWTDGDYPCCLLDGAEASVRFQQGDAIHAIWVPGGSSLQGHV